MKGSQSWSSVWRDRSCPSGLQFGINAWPRDYLWLRSCCKNNNNHGIGQHSRPIKNQSLAFWSRHCRGTSVNSHSAIGALRPVKETSLAVSSSTGKKVRNSLSLSLHDDIAAWCYNYAITLHILFILHSVRVESIPSHLFSTMRRNENQKSDTNMNLASSIGNWNHARSSQGGARGMQMHNRGVGWYHAVQMLEGRWVWTAIYSYAYNFIQNWNYSL